MCLLGSFLVQRKLVTCAQVVQALDAQTRRRVPPHAIAVTHGILSPRQVLAVMDRARDLGQGFVETARLMGVLDLATGERIETESARTGPRLGDILVEMQAIERPRLEEALADMALEAHRAGRSPVGGQRAA